MKGTKRVSLDARKKFKIKKKRLVRSFVAYLKSDGYFFSPLFSNLPPSNSESSKTDEISMAGFEALGIDRVNKKKRRISERVKEYLKSDCYMYGPMISSMKLGSTSMLKGDLQVTNLVTMEVSTSTAATMRKEKNYMNLRSEVAEQTLHHNGRINSPKRAVVILEEQRTGLSRDTDLSSAFSYLPEEKMLKPDQRRVTTE